MTDKKQASNHGIAKLLFTLVVLGVVVFVAANFVDFSAVSDTFAGLNYHPSEEMSVLIERDNLTKTGMRILRASRPELLEASEFNTKCYSGVERENSVLGCYANNDAIYLYDIQNEELNGIKETVLAHELLHAIWHRMGISERRALYEDIDKVYDAHTDELGQHMTGYRDDEHYDELHSVIGTQISSDQLPDSLRKHYAKYFNEQSKIVSYYNAYNGKFQKLEQRAKELSEKIDANREEIDRLTNDYETESADLLKNIQSFNARAENGGFSDSASFFAERNELVYRQNKLSEDFENLNSLIDETNELIGEYNNSVIEVGNLYDSVNSRVEKPAENIED